jgi:hypothetical protein
MTTSFLLGYKYTEITKLKMNNTLIGKTFLEDTRRACEPRGLGPHRKKLSFTLLEFIPKKFVKKFTPWLSRTGSP